MLVDRVRQVRESIAIGLIAVVVFVMVCAFLGLALTFKYTVETGQKLRHPFSRTA
jgi:hypothetical protein